MNAYMREDRLHDKEEELAHQRDAMFDNICMDIDCDADEERMICMIANVLASNNDLLEGFVGSLLRWVYRFAAHTDDVDTAMSEIVKAVRNAEMEAVSFEAEKRIREYERNRL